MSSIEYEYGISLIYVVVTSQSLESLNDVLPRGLVVKKQRYAALIDFESVHQIVSKLLCVGTAP